MGSGGTSAIVIGVDDYYGAGERPAEIPAAIADLDELRARLVTEEKVTLLMNRGGTGANSGRDLVRLLRRELSAHTNGLVPVLGTAAPSQASDCTPTALAAAPAPTFTNWTTESRTGYAFLTDATAPSHILRQPRPDTPPRLDIAVAPTASPLLLRASPQPLADALYWHRLRDGSSSHVRTLELWDFGNDPSRIISRRGPVSYLAVSIDLTVLPGLRADLVRFIDDIRAALWLALVLVLAALARCPETPCLVLVLVAASRRYGRRSEPDDYALPANQPISVIGGEFVLHR